MFTGIIEDIARVVSINKNNKNLEIVLDSSIVKELKIDQSVSHNGVCLTVDGFIDKYYRVTAVDETLLKTNISLLQEGDLINLERSLKITDRIDGHIVQGHVDSIAICKSINDSDGSWVYTFEYNHDFHFIVEKGSICVNGVSLTVVNSCEKSFSVAIIPYTFENTNFKYIKVNTVVNLEFDIIGKYITGWLKKQNS